MNQLETLDVSQHPHLKKMNSWMNRLHTLNLPTPHPLKKLECSDNCHPTPAEKPNTATERAQSTVRTKNGATTEREDAPRF